MKLLAVLYQLEKQLLWAALQVGPVLLQPALA